MEKSNDFSSEASEPALLKSLGRRMKDCKNGHGPLIKMATMPIYGKNLKKSSSPEPKKPWAQIFAQIIGDRRSTKIAKMMVLCWRLTFLPPRSNLLPNAFVWAIYIYIGSIEVSCRSTIAKIILIGNLRWPSSCICSLYFPATVLFTCIKYWFFSNHLANFHQISHWSYCWNVIDSLLAHLSRKLKVGYCDHHRPSSSSLSLSSSSSVCPFTIFKHHLLLNHCLEFDQISQEWSLVGPLSKLFKWFQSIAYLGHRS